MYFMLKKTLSTHQDLLKPYIQRNVPISLFIKSTVHSNIRYANELSHLRYKLDNVGHKTYSTVNELNNTVTNENVVPNTTKIEAMVIMTFASNRRHTNTIHKIHGIITMFDTLHNALVHNYPGEYFQTKITTNEKTIVCTNLPKYTTELFYVYYIDPTRY